MSRDWKPIELFYVNQHFDDALRNSSIVMTDRQGNKTRLDNYLSKERYPELSFFLDGFDQIYLRYKDNKKACAVLEEIDSCLKDIEEALLADETPEFKEGFVVVEKWFKGELDPNFYYAYKNNELFVEWIEDCIAEAIRNKASNKDILILD